MFCPNIGKDGQRHKMAPGFGQVALQKKCSFPFPHLDMGKNFLLRMGINNRTNKCFGLFCGAQLYTLSGRSEAIYKLVIDFMENNDPGAR